MADEFSYSILIPVDGSEHATRAAEYVARVSKLRPCVVELLYVDAPHAVSGQSSTEDDARFTAATTNARACLDRAGVSYRVHRTSGEPAAAIIAELSAGKHDEVVLGTRGLGPLANLALGSVAYRVAQAAQAPVTLVPPARHDGKAEANRILLAVDGSPASLHATNFVCARHAGATPLEVHVLNVQLPILSGNVRRFVTQETIDTYYREEGEAALAAATHALRDAGMQFHSHILAGHQAQTIVGEAERLGCSRIVMGNRGMGAMANAVLGSVAFAALHLASLPITLVK